ncbi:MAG: hypothetical protein IKR11_02345 [Solobacterium sp.]|nr:hypothetical protein [Solobacterium sp.]
MADQITNYQCPACGGPLHFDSETQKLKCDYCGSTFTVAEITEQYQDKIDIAAEQPTLNEEAAEVLQWTEEEKKHLRAYSCPSCGAQLICDEHTAATSCPYCGNPTVVPAQFSGALKPDYVIPFKLNKQQAVEKLSSYYKGKPLLPSAFSNNNHIQEIKGVYVPFWLYDGEADARLTFHGTRIHTQTRGDDIITITEHYQLVRNGTVEFNKVPADASSKMPDELMDAIEPFNYNEMVPFNISYLPGYLADKYDVSSEEDARRVDVRMKNTAIQKISQTVTGYSSVTPEQQHVHILPEKVHYAFLPVWMLSAKWNGNNYLFAMNGQTGKFVGDLPVDNKKFALYFILITAALVLVIGFLTWQFI